MMMMTANNCILYILFYKYSRDMPSTPWLERVSPYVWSATGIALAFGLSIIGAAWYYIYIYIYIALPQ